MWSGVGDRIASDLACSRRREGNYAGRLANVDEKAVVTPVIDAPARSTGQLRRGNGLHRQGIEQPCRILAHIGDQQTLAREIPGKPIGTWTYRNLPLDGSRKGIEHEQCAGAACGGEDQPLLLGAEHATGFGAAWYRGEMRVLLAIQRLDRGSGRMGNEYPSARQMYVAVVKLARRIWRNSDEAAQPEHDILLSSPRQSPSAASSA